MPTVIKEIPLQFTEEPTGKCSTCGQDVDYGVFSSRNGARHCVGYYCTSPKCKGETRPITPVITNLRQAERWMIQIEKDLNL